MKASILQGRNILFIGAGPMAESIVRGLVEGDVADVERVTVTNRSNQARLAELQTRYGVQTVHNLFERTEVIEQADVIVLAVNPEYILPVLGQIKPYLQKPTVISVAAGVTTEEMEAVADGQAEVVRVMPNTACAVLESATLVCYGETCSQQGRAFAKAILATLGTVSELQEQDMDGVTAITGCGPAFIYALVEAMQLAAVDLGVSLEDARAMVRQTLLGSAKMMEVTGLDAVELRNQVTSPGGVTMAGLEAFANADLNGIVTNAVQRVIERTNEITNEMRSRASN
ncbi:MAG: pyrroline-5-carboxylate reductase [Tumebacillaceae bacterium]